MENPRVEFRLDLAPQKVAALRAGVSRQTIRSWTLAGKVRRLVAAGGYELVNVDDCVELGRLRAKRPSAQGGA